MQRHKGFTLIEVLAALIIVSLGMLAVIRAVSQTVSNTYYLRQKTLAHWVAMNKLTEVHISATAPSTDDSTGEVDMAGITWRWKMKVTAVPGSNTMQQITINVAPKDAGDDASIASVFGVYGNAFTPAVQAPGWDANPLAVPPNTPNGSGSSSSSSSSSRNTRPSVLN